MAIVKCSKGHFYDNQKFDECPHCKRNELQGKTEREKEFSTVAKFSNLDKTRTNSTFDTTFHSDTSGKTQSIYSKKNMNPVSGWLVCIDGENKGRSFDLHIGKNFVGRSMKSDVIINDPQVSRENHFSIIFEPKESKFYVSMGASIIHVNSEVLKSSAELFEDDVIEAGSSKFVFVPFCKEGRDWNE